MLNDATNKNHGYYLVELSLTVLCYWFAAQLGLFFSPSEKFIPIIWPASGVAVAVLLIAGIRLWPGILVGALILAYSTTDNALISISLALGNTLETVAIFYVLRNFAHLDLYLNRLRDLAAIIFLGAGAGAFFNAAIATLTLIAADLIPSNIWLTTLAHVWMADSLGYLLFTPLILTLYANRNLAPIITNKFEPIALLLLVALASYLTFFNQNHNIIFNVIGLYLMFPCAMWAAYRFHQRGSAIITLIIGMTAIWSVSHQQGFFASKNIVLAEEYWFFVATLSIFGLILSIIHTIKLGAEDLLIEMIESVNAIIWRATPEFNFTFVMQMVNPKIVILCPFSNGIT